MDELSVEQAVEVILKGNPWKECLICLGCAIRLVNTSINKTPQEGWSMMQHPCPGCEGKGYVIRPLYQAALDVLKMCPPTEAPPPVARSITVTQDGKNTYR